ncbi:MAG: cryptochrome/photolyase family protein, partial [Pseudomonadales bacterium]|nr:cryptochrome/photolyase family protein [Pseudomonadales bacterium]
MKLGIVLGDQLSPNLPTLNALNRNTDRVVMAELAEEASYVKHHQQKIALIFSAMRHFARDLQEAGWRVDYYRYGEHEFPDFETLLAATTQDAEEVVVTHCGEYRLQQRIDTHWHKACGIPVTCLDDNRFLCSTAFFRQWASGKKQLRMEFFYREMRRHTGLLMEGDEPVGGQWNFDSNNRQPYKGKTPLPPVLTFDRDDTDEEVLALVGEQFAGHMGSLERFQWGTTSAQAQQALDHFIEHRLPHFGDYQDAMVSGEDTLFHSLLSPYINLGLLDPMTVCQAAEQAYFSGEAPLNAVEGFIRQIIGWREYVRGIYWLLMPDYAKENRLGNDRPLPAYYWTGETKMHCMAECFRNTLDHAYAHHIQRLMLTGERFLYHSVLSHYITAGLLDPLAVCRRVEVAYRDGAAPLNAAEGFIRQIIGWREYVRGIYWLKMPDYVDRNFFAADRPLPEFYWTGETDMACLRAAITPTREDAYAHHIQRLMVTGNFAMLAGVDPREVHEWYLAVYADAYEWVELPNTLGMSQFADGGLLGSKPYA